jgi:hypothetical protein
VSPPAWTIQFGRLPRPVHVWLGSFGLRYLAADFLPFILRPPKSSATLNPDALAMSSIFARISCRSLTRLAARDLPFIFYTGQTETPTAASWPSVPCLVKPLPAKEVVEMLARVMSAKGGHVPHV